LPDITEFARTYLNVEPLKVGVPIVPTAHYAMGGIPTNVNAEVLGDHTGQVVPGFYAAGECACVSVHGANRLGTNSLLDIIVFGRRGGLAMAEHASTTKLAAIPEDAHRPTEEWIASLFDGGGPEYSANIRSRLQDVMMDKASVVRTEESLGEAEAELATLQQRYAQARVRDRSRIFNTELVEHIELGFLLDMAEALVISARARTESRGGHYREDHQMRDDEHWLKHSFISRSPEGQTSLAYKDVTMGRYVPVERKY
jgi:succinate dehydrogenase / fumarate reductase flavoprotein subunit